MAKIEVSDRERQLRKRWYEAHRRRFLADEVGLSQIDSNYAGFDASAAEALELLVGLRRSGGLDAFIGEIRKWAVKPGTLAFNGHSGQMMLNQLAKHSDDPERLARLLAESLSEPGSERDAVSKIATLVAYVEEIKVGSHPAPGHVPFLCSYFWGLANHQRWPVIWTSGASYIEYSTGESLPEDQAEKYGFFLKCIRELTDDPVEFEKTASWWQDRLPVFLDEVLTDRASFGLDAEAATEEDLERNARALVSVASFWGQRLANDVEEALGRAVTVGKPSVHLKQGNPRSDVWVDWRVQSSHANDLNLRVWTVPQGAAVGLRPGVRTKGWRKKIAEVLDRADYPGCRVLGNANTPIGDDVGLLGAHGGEIVYGRWLDRENFADLDLAATVVDTARQLRPLFDEMSSLATGSSTASPEVPDDDPLKPIVDEWLAETDYPAQWHKDRLAQRERFAELLAPERISIDDWPEIRRIWTTKEAGGAGAMGTLNTALKDADESEIRRFLEIVRYLCWGTDPDVERIRRVLEDDEMRFTGLGESLVMKFLWISHPERYGYIYKYWDDNGLYALKRGRRVRIFVTG